VDVQVVQGKIQCMFIEGKSGREAIVAKEFIDCTGDADLVVRSGLSCMNATPEELQASTLNIIIANVDTEKLRQAVLENPGYYDPNPLLNMDQLRDQRRYILCGLEGFVQHCIKNNPKWELVGIYADEARTETNTYTLTFSREGFEDYTIPYEWAVGDLFADGKAHFSVIASCEIAPENGWTYYITNIENGVALTEEEIAAMEAAKAEAERLANVEAATKETDGVAEDVAEIVARAEATGSQAAIDKAAEAQAAIDASYAAIEANEFEEAKTQSDLARDLVKETKDLCKEAEEEAAPNEGEVVEGGDEVVEGDEVAEGDDAAEEGGFPLWIVFVIIAVVVVVVVVVVVLGKKKN